MRIAYQSFEGRYSDSPRALYEAWVRERPGDVHTWLADPAHLAGFPAGVETVPAAGPECVAALEAADLLIANTHTDMEWNKRCGATYLQTWHGTPLKRIHNDALWAPAGRLARLAHDVNRWDILLSPNHASTDTLRRAFDFSGEVLETGYPRNDVLNSPERDALRRRVRADLDLADDTTVVLYTPTWRDNAVFAEGLPDIELSLRIEQLMKQLGDDFCLLVRVHYLMTDRLRAVTGPQVRDVSYYPDIADLYLAADAMVTDYSSTMFDFAITGKPLLFFAYDLESFRDEVRGFYFDLEEIAPGPLVRTQEELGEALLDLPGVRRRYAAAYQSFQERFCSLEDGSAGARVLRRLWGESEGQA